MELETFYEVTDRYKEVVWGGTSAPECIGWFRSGVEYRVFASVWDTKDEDFKLITDKIEITNVLLATILNEKERK